MTRERMQTEEMPKAELWNIPILSSWIEKEETATGTEEE